MRTNAMKAAARIMESAHEHFGPDTIDHTITRLAFCQPPRRRTRTTIRVDRCK